MKVSAARRRRGLARLTQSRRRLRLAQSAGIATDVNTQIHVCSKRYNGVNSRTRCVEREETSTQRTLCLRQSPIIEVAYRFANISFSTNKDIYV